MRLDALPAPARLNVQSVKPPIAGRKVGWFRDDASATPSYRHSQTKQRSEGRRLPMKGQLER